MKNRFHLEHKMKAAYDFEMQGKPLHSLQIYQSLVNEHPDYIEAYFGLAEIYEKLDNIGPAVKLFKLLLEDDPENKKVRLFYGQYLLRNSKWNEAIEAMSYLVPKEEPIVSFFLGYSHFMLKEFEIAKINFINFIKIKDQTDLVHEAYLYLSKIEINLSNFESALSYAKRTEIIYSNSCELNQIFASIYYNLGMYEHAVLPIERAIKLNKKEPSSYEWAGKIYLKLGDYLKAEKNFIKYIESIEEATSETYTKLAEACLKSKKTRNAMDYYDIAIKLDPYNNAAVEGKKTASSILDKRD